LTETRAAWPARPIAADANGSFRSPHELTRWLDGLGLQYIEQPFAPNALAAHAALRAQVSTPVALDESVASVDDLHAALDAGALQVLSLKPARVGGVEAARRMLDVAADHGLDVFVGGMLETGIGRATAVTLAACDGVSLPTDLGPSSRYFDRDICEPIELVAGRLPVPSGPGIGRVPDVARLGEVVVTWADL
jgi:O-succinylbenzoate synthase